MLGNENQLALVKTAPSVSVQVIRDGQGAAPDRYPTLRSFRGRFHLLTLGETSSVEIFDPGSPDPVDPIPIPTEVYDESLVTEEDLWAFYPDLAMLPTGTLLMTVPGRSTIFSHDASSGGWTVFANLATDVAGSFTLRHMLVLEDLLLVAVHRFNGEQTASGAVAVVDLTSRDVIRIIDLLGQKPTTPLDHDALRKKVWVTANGDPSSDNGAYNRIDVDPASPNFLTVDYSYKAPPFEGLIVLGKDHGSVFIVEHTEMPTRSTHTHHYLLGPSGTLDDLVDGETHGEDLTVAFEGNDNLLMNTSRDLAVSSFNCKYWACPLGGGLYLFDGATGVPLQKIYAEGKVPPGVEPAPTVTIPFLVSGFTILRR